MKSCAFQFWVIYSRPEGTKNFEPALDCCNRIIGFRTKAEGKDEFAVEVKACGKKNVYFQKVGPYR